MVNRIINKMNELRKNLVVYRIILKCYKDTNRLEAISFIEVKLNELVKDNEKYLASKDNGDYNWLNNKLDNDAYTNDQVYNQVEDYINYRCKMISVMILKNMYYEDLVIFEQKMDLYLSKFNDTDEAAEYICYHTGNDISDFINSLFNYVAKVETELGKKTISLEYYEKYRTILSLDIKQWIDIYNHLRYTMRSLKILHKKDYLKLLEQYNLIIMYYFILVTSPNFYANV